MTYSKLANLGFKKANNYTPGRGGQKICKITPHFWANAGNGQTCEWVVNMWNSSRPASSTYLIDDRGNILCAVHEEDRPWTSSNTSNDNQAITLEISTLDNNTGEITQKAWQATVRLCTDICHRYNFRLNYTGNSNGSLTLHKWFAATSCPGPWLESHMKELADTVNKNLDTGNFDYSGVASGYGNSSGSSGGVAYIDDPAVAYAAGINAKILPSQEDTHHFVISIDEKTKALDFEKLKEADVTWVCIDIGTYFAENFTKNAVFRQSKLEKQVKACKDAKFPFALMTTIRGRNEKEALEELSEIRLAVLKYPPSMGIWLKPNFKSKSSKTNDKLVKIYYDYLVNLGFKDQVGFYCKKDELEKITWTDSACEEWYWWMDKHLKTLDDIDGLPTPRFFMYENPNDEFIQPDWEGAANLQFTSGSGGDSEGYTDYQQAVADAAESGEGCSTVANMCGEFVKDVFVQARKKKSDIRIPFGNGYDYWTKWKSSGGTDKNPPVGSVVVGSGWPYGGSATENPYGHVGVVITGGRIADNVGRHRISKDLDAWLSGQSANCNGHRGYIGWVWASGQDLSKMGTMIGGGLGRGGTGNIKLPNGLGTYATREFDLRSDRVTTGMTSPYGFGLSTTQRRVQDAWIAAGAKHDEKGFCKLNGRYLVATTSIFGEIGSHTTFYFSNNTSIETIKIDAKAETVVSWDPNPANKWGHANGANVLEFCGQNSIGDNPYITLGLNGVTVTSATVHGVVC